MLCYCHQSESNGEFSMNLFQGKEMPVQVRWMVRRDFAKVQTIEQACFEFPWTEEEFRQCLQQPNCLCVVAEYEGQVVGYVVYETPKNRIFISNIAVDPEFQRHNVARQMVQKLVSKMLYQRRHRIVVEIRETNLPALLCFRALGFRASTVLKNFYEDQSEDTYVLQYQLGKEHVDPVYAPATRTDSLLVG
jgi:ribosomal-protein-alanine N-acetyltransferase